MQKPKVKICGITNLIDAKNALGLGADYIGFVSVVGSPRFVSIDQIKEISEQLTPEEKLKCVLLSDTDSIDQIVADCSALEFHIVQPYGNHKLKDLRSLGLFEVEVFMPVGVSNDKDIDDLKSYKDYASLIVLDNKKNNQIGGTGESFDWSLFNKAKSLTELNLALAGGLSPDNILTAVEETDPYMIDLSSGLESQPGIKSLDKMKELFAKLN